MPKICIVKFEHLCGGYECDPSVIQDSDWFDVTDDELKYFQLAIHDYESKIYEHGIVIKPELNLAELKLKSKEYYDRILASQKKKEEAKKLKEKKAKEESEAKIKAKKLKKLEQLQLELGIAPKSE